MFGMRRLQIVLSIIYVFRENRRREGRTDDWGKWNYICRCFVKPHDILKAKKALVKSAYSDTE
jgi:hypothetical protein